MTALRSLLPAGGSTVGIDIGKHAIKVAQVRGTGKGVELQRWGVAPTPRGSVDGGVISDPQAVAQVLPCPVDEAVIDVQTVGQVTMDERRQLEVLLAAAPEALVLTYIQTLESARLMVEAIEVAALAMTRGLARSVGSGTHVLVNLGASMTDVAVVQDGVPQFTRTILVGNDAVTQAIGKLLKVDEEAAEEAKRRYGLGWEEWPPDRAEGAYAAEMVEALSEVVLQVRRSLDYFRAQFSGGTISDMILCGGGALLRHLDRHLTSELGLPVTIGNPLDGMQPGEQLLAAQALAPQLAVATGLALRMIA